MSGAAVDERSPAAKRDDVKFDPRFRLLVVLAGLGLGGMLAGCATALGSERTAIATFTMNGSPVALTTNDYIEVRAALVALLKKYQLQLADNPSDARFAVSVAVEAGDNGARFKIIEMTEVVNAQLWQSGKMRDIARNTQGIEIVPLHPLLDLTESGRAR